MKATTLPAVTTRRTTGRTRTRNRISTGRRQDRPHPTGETVTKRDKKYGTTKRTNGVPVEKPRNPGAFQHTGYKIKHGKKVKK